MVHRGQYYNIGIQRMFMHKKKKIELRRIEQIFYLNKSKIVIHKKLNHTVFISSDCNLIQSNYV